MAQPIYALGLGCERGCEPQELLTLANSVLTEAKIAAMDLIGVFTIDQRRDEPAVVYIAEQFGLPVTSFSAAMLERETSRLHNPSERVFALMGCHGVAEAAALAGVGPTGILVVGKIKSAHATAALAVTKR